MGIYHRQFEIFAVLNVHFFQILGLCFGKENVMRYFEAEKRGNESLSLKSAAQPLGYFEVDTVTSQSFQTSKNTCNVLAMFFFHFTVVLYEVRLTHRHEGTHQKVS